MLDIKYRLTCGDSDLVEVIKKCQNIMTRIVKKKNVSQEKKKNIKVQLQNEYLV